MQEEVYCFTDKLFPGTDYGVFLIYIPPSSSSSTFALKCLFAIIVAEALKYNIYVDPLSKLSLRQLLIYFVRSSSLTNCNSIFLTCL